MEKKLIYLETIESKYNNKNILDDICFSLFQKVFKIIQEFSRFGYLELIVGLTNDNDDDEYHIPKVIYWCKKIPELQKRFCKLLENKGFTIELIPNKYIKINWKDDDVIIPKISASDITELGHGINNMKLILNELTKAIIKKEVAETKQSQIIWIKKNFPLK